MVTLLDEAAEWLKWLLAQLLKALAWGVLLLSLGGLVVAFPAIGLLVISSFVPLMMVGAAAAGALSDWRDSRRPSTWIVGQGRGTLVRQDDFGKLWTLGSGLDGARRVRVVEVVNATPELDGSYRHYVLQVPPSVHTPREAVAWTFGFQSAREFAVSVES